MTDETKKALREAKIEWRKEMSAIIDHLLFGNEYYFEHLDDYPDEATKAIADKAMRLRHKLTQLSRTLEDMNEFSKMIAEG